jgi:ribosome-associated protein
VRAMKDDGVGMPRIDGNDESNWIVLDYFDVVVHIMMDDARTFYNLERMWGDAKVWGITSEGAAHELKNIPRRSAIS